MGLCSFKNDVFLDFGPRGGKFCAIRTILRQCSLLKRYTQTVQIGRFSEITKKNFSNAAHLLQIFGHFYLNFTSI